MTPQKAAFYNLMDERLMEIPGRFVFTRNGRISNIDPEHYPPPKVHRKLRNDITPTLFPLGYHTHRRIEIDTNIMTSDVIGDIQATYHIPQQQAIEYVSKHYNIAIGKIYSQMMEPFIQFFDTNKPVFHNMTGPGIGRIFQNKNQSNPQIMDLN